MSESAVLTDIRLAASRLGWRLYRNNKGAGKLENGSFIRWGLCNESAAVGAQVRSADLIGIRPVLITQDMVGQMIGQFVSVEVKAPGWKPSATNEHEIAQRRWASLINGLGGYAVITASVDAIVNMSHTAHVGKISNE